MTIVGSAYVEIQALGDKFNANLQQQVTPGLRNVGMIAEQQAGRGRQAFGTMFSALRSSTAGAFNPIFGFIDHVQTSLENISKKPLTLKLTAIGAAGLGVGAGLQMFASKEQAAQQQLSATLETLNLSYDDYSGAVDKAVKHGEHFGAQSYQTIDALNRLTVSTRDPAKALKDYNLVLDIAAARHMSISRAAQMVASAYGGNTRIFRQFGINVADSNKALAAAKKGDDQAAKAAGELTKAKQRLRDEEARLAATQGKRKSNVAALASAEASLASAEAAIATARFKHGQSSPQAAAAQARLVAAEARLTQVRQQASQKGGLTVSQEISLRNARNAVSSATDKYNKAMATKVKADDAAKGATTGVDANLAKLQARLKGQASAAADTFTGHMHALTAEVEDQVAQFGKNYGPAVTAGSTALIGLGAVSSLVKGGFDRFSPSARTARGVVDELSNSTKIQTAAMHDSLGATTTLMNSQTVLKEVDSQLGTTFATTAAETEASMTGMATTAETQIAGQMQLSLDEVGVTAEELPAKMSVAAAGVEASMTEMSIATETNSLRMQGAVGGLVGAIGAFGIGTATAGHGAGGAAVGTLGGAVTGAIIGLSVGGPLGAAIGGLGGALAGLAGHFLNLGGNVSESTQEVKNFQKQLQAALDMEHKLGPQSKDAINQFLSAPKQADNTALLAQAGVNIDQIVQSIRKGTMEPGTAGAQVQAALRQGKITQADAVQLLKFLGTMQTSFMDIVNQSDALATINGQVTQNMQDTAANLKSLLKSSAGQADATGTIASLLLGGSSGKPTGRTGGGSRPLARAAGGPVLAGRSYWVGERGPELLSMGGASGSITPFALGGQLVAELQALRMDFLQLINTARSTTRAVEDTPHGIVRELGRSGGGRFRSPELATL